MATLFNPGVTAHGTPVDNQLAVWKTAGSVEGDANLTWSGSILQVLGSVAVGDSANAAGLASGGPVRQVVNGPNAKATSGLQTPFFVGTDDAIGANPLGLAVSLYGDASAANRRISVEATHFGDGLAGPPIIFQRSNFSGWGQGGVVGVGHQVGDTAPQGLLHVVGDNEYGQLRISPRTANSGATIGFYDDNAATDTNDAWIVGATAGSASAGVFAICNENNGGGGDIRLQITKAGVVSTPATGTISCPGGSGSEKFGAGASASGSNTTIVGNGSTSTLDGNVVIGPSLTPAANNQILIGNTILTPGTSQSVIMIGSSMTGTNGSSGGVAIGRSINLTGATATVAIGSSVICSGTKTTAVGQSATASGSESTTIGNGSTASGAGACAFGVDANAGHSPSICIGRTATSTAVNQCVIGSNNCAISTMYIGKGVTSSAPASLGIFGTGGSGTDIAGSTVTIQAGLGTGAATPASVIIASSTAGASSSTLQTTVTRIQVNGTGIGFFAVTPVARPAAYDQSAYTTTTRTLTAALTNSTGGSSDGTLADVTAAHDQTILNNNFTDLHTKILNLQQALNQVIDDVQAFGLFQ